MAPHTLDFTEEDTRISLFFFFNIAAFAFLANSAQSDI